PSRPRQDRPPGARFVATCLALPGRPGYEFHPVLGASGLFIQAIRGPRFGYNRLWRNSLHRRPGRGTRGFVVKSTHRSDRRLESPHSRRPKMARTRKSKNAADDAPALVPGTAPESNGSPKPLVADDANKVHPRNELNDLTAREW